MSFEVKIEGNFIKQFGKIQKDVEKLAQKNLKKTANELDKEIHRVVTSNQLINITFEDFIRRSKTKSVYRFSDLNSGLDGMNIQIEIKSRPYTSYRFFPNYIGPAKKKVWIGRIEGKAKKFYGGRAFAIKDKKPLFARKGDGKYPLMPVYGPNIPDMLERSGLAGSIYSFASERLKVNFSKVLSDAFD